jgi:hypothetical protein
MSLYFSEVPIWFDQSEELKALNHKGLLPIKDGNPDLTAHLRVLSADPHADLKREGEPWLLNDDD